MQRRVFMVLACALLAVLALSGCTQVKQIVTPKPQVKHVTIEATVAVPGAPITGKLAKGGPANLPLWPGAVVMKSKVTKSASGNSWVTTLGTRDPYVDVLNGVGVGFQNANWQVAAQDTSSAEASAAVLTVSGEAADGVVTFSITKDGITEIGYVFTAKK